MRSLFRLPTLAAAATVRVDTAAGTQTPAAITDSSGRLIADSRLTSDPTGALPAVYGPDSIGTLYVKRLNYLGAVVGSAIAVEADPQPDLDGGGADGSSDLSAYETAAHAAATYQPIDQAVSEQQVLSLIDTAIAAVPAGGGASVYSPAGPVVSGLEAMPRSGLNSQASCLAQQFSITADITVDCLRNDGMSSAGNQRYEVGLATSLGSIPLEAAWFRDAQGVRAFAEGFTNPNGGFGAAPLPTPVQLPAGTYWWVLLREVAGAAFPYRTDAAVPIGVAQPEPGCTSAQDRAQPWGVANSVHFPFALTHT